MAKQRQHARQSGFTLVELIISIVLLGLLATVGTSMIADSFSLTRIVNANQADTVQARYALERMAREIREVKYLNTSRYCITTMNSAVLRFDKVDVAVASPDPASCSSGTTIVTLTCNSDPTAVTTPCNSNGLLLSTPVPPASAPSNASLVSRVATNGFSFAYFQSDGVTSATSNTNVAFIQITLTVTNTTSGQTFAQRTRVALRNTL